MNASTKRTEGALTNMEVFGFKGCNIELNWICRTGVQKKPLQRLFNGPSRSKNLQNQTRSHPSVVVAWMTVGDSTSADPLPSPSAEMSLSTGNRAPPNVHVPADATDLRAPATSTAVLQTGRCHSVSTITIDFFNTQTVIWDVPHTL